MSSDGHSEDRRIGRRAPRWLWILFIGSLSFNMLLVGAIGGTLWAVRRGGMWDAPVMVERTWRFLRGLPPDMRADIRSLLVEHRSELRPQLRKLRQARVNAVRLAAASSFDEKAFRASYAQLTTAEIELRNAAEEMIIAVMKRLPAEQRIRFLKMFERRTIRIRYSEEPGKEAFQSSGSSDIH